MGYASAYRDLGSVVTLPAGDLVVARMQAAINRVLVNARTDAGLPSFSRDAARAQTLAPVPINGLADARTLAAAKSAGLVAGASTVEVTNAAFTEKLESFADSRGYPRGDTVERPGIIPGLPPIPGIAGISGKTVAIAAGGLVLAFFLLRRRS